MMMMVVVSTLWITILAATSIGYCGSINTDNNDTADDSNTDADDDDNATDNNDTDNDNSPIVVIEMLIMSM